MSREPDVIYFDVVGLVVIRYPLALAILFALVTCFLFAAVVALGLRRHLLTVRGMLFGVLRIYPALSLLLPWLQLFGG